MENNSDLHFLVYKQLKRANITPDDISPNKRKEWEDFLARISRAYYSQEQEQYLIERSMEISSREMMSLNEKLEFAHKIARLGYWFYDSEEDKLTFSKETFELTGIDPTYGIPPLATLMTFIHEDDRARLIKLMERALNEGKDYEIELRFKNQKDGKYYWHYAKGHPHVSLNNVEEKSGKVRYLSGIAIDITERKIAEENLKQMHQQLLAVSRQAGMAEVATSVLHNIGNILNSANISINMILEMLAKSKIDKLVKVTELIKEHIEKNDGYLTTDQYGKMMPSYLSTSVNNISEEYQQISMELNNIAIHLDHIKDVVTLQKDISGVVGIKEKILLHELVDLAIQMTNPSAEYNDIVIIKDYEFNENIFVEKAKLLQIVINLVKNAKDSILSIYENKPKEIHIAIKKLSDNKISLIIKDNGTGIATENLKRIFSLGFTTKPNGHGFGLHSSAITAKELGGSLKAESEGLGKGAVFTLELPLITSNEKSTTA